MRADRTVESIMQEDVAVVGPNDRLDLADDIMNLGRVRHLPVVDDDAKLVGVVSSRDLLRASLSQVLDFDPKHRRTFLRGVEVSEVMAGKPVTVSPDATQRHAGQLLLQRQIGCLPVVGPDCTLLGLVTETDLLRAFVSAEDEQPNTIDTRPTGGSDEEKNMDRNDLQTKLNEELGELRRIRDELRVQANLGAAEAKEAWERNEARFKDVEHKLGNLAEIAEDALEDVGEAVKLVFGEIRDGYKRLRDAV
jgi:CBS domain-containing membrane protein